MAVSWSTVSVKPKASSISACHGVSGPNACPGDACRLAYSDTSSLAIARTARRALVLVLAQSLPPSRLSVGASPPTYRESWSSESIGTNSLSDPPPRLLDAYSSTRYSRRAPLIVHHQITRGERERVGDVAAFCGQPLAFRRGDPVAGEVGFGDHDDVGPGQHHAVVQRPLEHAD